MHFRPDNQKKIMKLNPIAITNDVTQCEHCGKNNLKSTVVMRDDEGNIEYWGSDCASRAMGRSAASIVGTARAAMNQIAADNAHLQAQIDSINAIDRGMINLELRERLHGGWLTLKLDQPMSPEARREIYVKWMRGRMS